MDCFECGFAFVPSESGYEREPHRTSAVCPDCQASARNAEKYTDDAMWDASMGGACSEETGSVDELGWYARFDFDQTEQSESGYVGCILSQDAQGFKGCEWFDTAEALASAWSDIEADYAEFYANCED